MKTLGTVLIAAFLLVGPASAAPADEAAARTAAYPRAEYREDLGRLFVNGPQFGRGRAMAFVTAESFEKVAQFYKARPGAQISLGEEDLGSNILRYQAAFTGAALQKLNSLAKANLGKKIRVVNYSRITVGEFRFGLLVQRPYLSATVELVDQTLVVIIVK